MVLTGTEVKSLRAGKANLREAYAEVRGGNVWLVNCHISEYLAGRPVQPRAAFAAAAVAA